MARKMLFMKFKQWSGCRHVRKEDWNRKQETDMKQEKASNTVTRENSCLSTLPRPVSLFNLTNEANGQKFSR